MGGLRLADARPRWRARGAVILGAALLFLAGLGRVGAWPPDEPRYLAVAEEMRALEAGPAGLVVPRLNGQPYGQKPPLYFWLAALAGAPGGRVGEASARLPSALAGIGVVALTLGLGAALLGERSGLLGAAFLATTPAFAHLARRVQLDVLLALFETSALALFWRLDRGIGARRPQLALLHLALGLAVLTKGPVGLLVPLLVMGCFLAWERRLRDLRSLLPAWGWLLSLGPGLAWLAASAALAPEGGAASVLASNLLGRFFAGSVHARPVYYHLWHFPLDLLPWTLLAPVVYGVSRRALAAREDAGTRAAWRFLLAWLLASLLFFSLSQGKRTLYLLPAFPAAALLVAAASLRRFPGRAAEAWLAAAAVSVGIVELVVFVGVHPALDAGRSPRAVAEAAAALTPPGEPIGVVRNEALIGGIAYYGGRPVTALHADARVREFFEDGGCAIVARERDRLRLSGQIPLRTAARRGAGRLEILVLTPATSAPCGRRRQHAGADAGTVPRR